MSTPLNPQEIYLIERFCSLERFGQMRDAWDAMIKHAEEYLRRFMQQLPPDYRSRPLYNQPDIVWGERVLPNFRDTLQSLNNGYIRLSHGELNALGIANGVSNDYIALQRDYSSDWMDEVESGASDKFGDLIGEALRIANPIYNTAEHTWSKDELTVDYCEIFTSEPLNPPTSWPSYALNHSIRVKSGAPVAVDGIYLPAIENGAPNIQFVGKGVMGNASEILLRNAEGTTDWHPTTWTLVERIADSGGGIPGDADPIRAGIRLRCEAGRPCPQAGYWFTPARAGSRRRFEAGQVMPEVGGDYRLSEITGQAHDHSPGSKTLVQKNPPQPLGPRWIGVVRA